MEYHQFDLTHQVAKKVSIKSNMALMLWETSYVILDVFSVVQGYGQGMVKQPGLLRNDTQGLQVWPVMFDISPINYVCMHSVIIYLFDPYMF